MKRYALILCAVLGLMACGSPAQAGWFSLGKPQSAANTEEARLQKFWHDYYQAMKCYYETMDKIDWVAYYKNHGQQINAGMPSPLGVQQVNYAPVFASPNVNMGSPQYPQAGGVAPAGYYPAQPYGPPMNGAPAQPYGY